MRTAGRFWIVLLLAVGALTWLLPGTETRREDSASRQVPGAEPFPAEPARPLDPVAGATPAPQPLPSDPLLGAPGELAHWELCLLYTSDAADDYFWV